MYVMITAQVDRDDVDQESASGLTSGAYDCLTNTLTGIGYEDVVVTNAHPLDEGRSNGYTLRP
jgi:hypothetical protein